MGMYFICTQEPTNEPQCEENFSFESYLDLQPAHLSRFVSSLPLPPPSTSLVVPSPAILEREKRDSCTKNRAATKIGSWNP
jgi:hypothetical protein